MLHKYSFYKNRMPMFYELSYRVFGSKKPLGCEVELFFSGFKQLYNLPNVIGFTLFTLTIKEDKKNIHLTVNSHVQMITQDKQAKLWQ